MSIEAEGLEDWVGSEVVDADDNKLGKVSEVFYRDQDPLIVEIRSGLIGRKHHLAALAGSTVSMKHLRLSGGTVQSDGEALDREMLQELSKDDPRLANVVPEELESGTARKERLQAAREAAQHATALEAELPRRQEEASIAHKVAKQANDNAAAAQQAADEAALRATRARAHADELAGRPTGPADPNAVTLPGPGPEIPTATEPPAPAPAAMASADTNTDEAPPTPAPPTVTHVVSSSTPLAPQQPSDRASDSTG